MKTIKSCLAIFLSILLFAIPSCVPNPVPEGPFGTGVFIVNEGNFHSSDGTVSFYHTSGGAVDQDIFALKNNGKALGDIVQSMTVTAFDAFIVVNNDNKMEVADANTMEYRYTITGLSLPRYSATFNGKQYVTEWVSFTDPGRISVVNVETKAVESTIPVNDYGTENIILVNNKFYVSNSFSNTVSVIDPVQAKVVDTVEVSSSPGEFVVDKDLQLWVICGGGFDSNYTPLNDGALVRINPDNGQVTRTVLLGKNLAAKIAINGTRDKLFYFSGKEVFSINITDTSGPASALITEPAAVSFYGIGVDPSTNIIYVGDSKGFTGNGSVYRYTSAGAKLDEFTVGRGPNGFVFQQ